MRSIINCLLLWFIIEIELADSASYLYQKQVQPKIEKQKDSAMLKSITEMTVEIIRAQLLNKEMSKENVVEALKSIFAALKELKDLESGKPVASEAPAEKPEPQPVEPKPAEVLPAEKKTQASTAPPAIPEDSIQKDKVICLECGREFKQISHTHLKKHALTPKEYRRKHGLPASQPLTAKSLSEERKKRAKAARLGETLKKAREAKK